MILVCCQFRLVFSFWIRSWPVAINEYDFVIGSQIMKPIKHKQNDYVFVYLVIDYLPSHSAVTAQYQGYAWFANLSANIKRTGERLGCPILQKVL